MPGFRGKCCLYKQIRTAQFNYLFEAASSVSEAAFSVGEPAYSISEAASSVSEAASHMITGNLETKLHYLTTLFN